MIRYDSWYQEKHHFGKPYRELVTFFREHTPKGTVLDLGCGQGRDALALGRLGYEVTGVDTSKVGILQMLAEAKKENLHVTGVIADIYTYTIDPCYDMILLDSMLHFYKKDKEKEVAFLERIMKEMKYDGVLCIFLGKSNRAEAILSEVFNNSPFTWEVIKDTYIMYPEKSNEYKMFITRKEWQYNSR
jgi:trans-aconitate methyltransferase